MPNHCCVVGCRSNYNKTPYVSAFRFPRDEALRQLWLQKIAREDFKPSLRSVVCENHFMDEDILRYDDLPDKDGTILKIPRNHPRVRRGAYPRIFPEYIAHDTKKGKRYRAFRPSRLRDIAPSNQTITVQATTSKKSLSTSGRKVRANSSDAEKGLLIPKQEFMDSSDGSEQVSTSSGTTTKPTTLRIASYRGNTQPEPPQTGNLVLGGPLLVTSTNNNLSTTPVITGILATNNSAGFLQNSASQKDTPFPIRLQAALPLTSDALTKVVKLIPTNETISKTPVQRSRKKKTAVAYQQSTNEIELEETESNEAFPSLSKKRKISDLNTDTIQDLIQAEGATANAMEKVAFAINDAVKASIDVSKQIAAEALEVEKRKITVLERIATAAEKFLAMETNLNFT